MNGPSIAEDLKYLRDGARIENAEDPGTMEIFGGRLKVAYETEKNNNNRKIVM